MTSADLPADLSEFWRSSNPPWGVVRAVITAGEFLLVIDDLNSDFRELQLELYRGRGQHWHQIFELDDGGYPEIGSCHGGGMVPDEDDRSYGWTFGREQPGAEVQLIHGEDLLTVIADRDGWWLCVVETNDWKQVPRKPW